MLMESTVGEIFTVTVTPSQIVTSSAEVGRAAPVPAAQLVADHVIVLQLPVLRANRAAAPAFDAAMHPAISTTQIAARVRHLRIVALGIPVRRFTGVHQVNKARADR
jgi:hypothetical protein